MSACPEIDWKIFRQFHFGRSILWDVFELSVKGNTADFGAAFEATSDRAVLYFDTVCVRARPSGPILTATSQDAVRSESSFHFRPLDTAASKPPNHGSNKQRLIELFAGESAAETILIA